MKSPILGLALSTVAFGASSIYLWHQLTEQREQSDAVQKANTELNARIAELEKRRAEFVGHRMGAPGVFGGPAGAETGPAPVGPPPPPENRQTWASVARENHAPPPMPEAMMKMMRANVRAQMKRMYFDLQPKLGLTDEQTSDLFDLLADQESSGFKGPRNDPEAAREYWEAEQTKRKAALEDLLGTSKAVEFEDYQKSMPARSELMRISQQLEGVETPLSDTQRSRLLDALIEERERVPQPSYTDGTTPENMRKAYEDWQSDYEKRVSDAARSILTSQQLDTYNEYRQWEREMRQQFAAPGPGGGPPGRMRGNAAFIPAPGGGVAFAVTTDAASASPTEKPAQPK